MPLDGSFIAAYVNAAKRATSEAPICAVATRRAVAVADVQLPDGDMAKFR